jgi:ADP-heptose:LPS heptosyltransferase
MTLRDRILHSPLPTPHSSPYQTILFVELLGGLGDILIALPAIQALARSHPHAHLTVLTFAPGGDLLQTDPLIRQVIYALAGKARLALQELLQQQSFDLIISDTCYEGIDQLIQTSGAATVVTNLWRSPPPNERVGDRFIHILLDEGLITPAAVQPARLCLTPAEQQTARAMLAGVKHPAVVLYPDAGMTIKRWSVQNFVQVGQTLQQRYNATVIVPVGADAAEAEAIAIAIGGSACTWQRGDLRLFTAMLSCTDLMLACDTGPARIAAALGIPTVTLFGPSWHERYGHPTPHVNLQGYPDCPERLIHNFTEQRCWYAGTCPFDQWNTCLETISVDQVMTTVGRILDSGLQENSFWANT